MLTVLLLTAAWPTLAVVPFTIFSLTQLAELSLPRGLGTVACYLGCLSAAIYLGVANARSRNGPRSATVGLAALPLAGFVWIMLVSADVPFRTRLAFSEGDLLTYTKIQFEGSATRSREARWVGLFHVRETTVSGGCVRVITTDSFIDDAGLVYCDHFPSFGSDDRYEHIRGPWWRWIKHF